MPLQQQDGQRLPQALNQAPAPGTYAVAESSNTHVFIFSTCPVTKQHLFQAHCQHPVINAVQLKRLEMSVPLADLPFHDAMVIYAQFSACPVQHCS